MWSWQQHHRHLGLVRYVTLVLSITWMYSPWPTYVELVTAPPSPWARSLCDAGSQRHLYLFPLADICGAGHNTAVTLGPFVM